MSTDPIESLRDAIQTYVDDIVPNEEAISGMVNGWWDALARLEQLRDAAAEVVSADNQDLGAFGMIGERAMDRMVDALADLRAALAGCATTQENT